MGTEGGTTSPLEPPSEVNCSSCSFQLTPSSPPVNEIHIYSATNEFEKSVTILDALSEIFGITNTPPSTTMSSPVAASTVTVDKDNLKLARDAGVTLLMCSQCAEILSVLYKDFLTLVQISAATGYMTGLLRHMDTWQKKFLSESDAVIIIHGEEEITIFDHEPIAFEMASELNQVQDHTADCIDDYYDPQDQKGNEGDPVSVEFVSVSSASHEQREATEPTSVRRKRKRRRNLDSNSVSVPKKWRSAPPPPRGSGPTRHFFRCNLCPKAFFLNWELRDHSLHFHEGKQRTACGKCDWEYFPEIFTTETHTCPRQAEDSDDESSALISCPLCTSTFRTEAIMKQHLDAAHVLDTVKFGCVICHKNCIRRATLLQHYFLHHPETRHGQTDQWQCSHCGMTFGEETELSSHTTTTHAKELEERPEVCNFCEKRFPDREGKAAHMRHAHGYHKRTKNKSSPDAHPCQLCPRPGKTFISAKRLRKHMKTTHGNSEEKKHQCNICAKRFWTGAKLRTHMGIHTYGTNSNTKIPNEFKEYNLKYNCKYCPVTFDYKAHMDLHNRNFHLSKEISHTCPVCAEKFSSNVEYLIHRRKHMTPEERKVNTWTSKGAEGEFDCDICLKTYTTLKNLSTHHNYVHVGNSVINCELCKKELRARNLTYHYKTFHPEKHAEMEQAAALDEEISKVPETLTCDVCHNGKTYSSKFSLLEHKGIHGGTHLKVACPQCEVKVRSNSRLELHLRRVHSATGDPLPIPTPRKPPQQRKTALSMITKGPDGGYICTICNNGKLYASLKTLREHQLIHNDAHLKFTCDLCGHRVRRESHLRAHMKTAHPPKIRDDDYRRDVKKGKRKHWAVVVSEQLEDEPPSRPELTPTLILIKPENIEEDMFLSHDEQEDSFIKFYNFDEIEREKRLQIRLTRIRERAPYF